MAHTKECSNLAAAASVSAVSSVSLAFLSEFIGAYIVAALWTEYDGDEENLDTHFGPLDLAPDAARAACLDCAEFLAHCSKADLNFDKLNRGGYHNPAAAAGHDFLLTRNGHGAGFWDGDWDKGDELSEIARSFGEVHFYIGDDGHIYSE